MFGRCAAAFCWACIEDARHERAAREIIDLFIRIDKLVMLYVCRNCWGFGHFQKKVYKSTKKFWILSFEFWVLNCRRWRFWVLSFEFWVVAFGDFWVLSFEFWIVAFGDFEFWVLSFELSPLAILNCSILNCDLIIQNSKLKNSKSALPTIQNSKTQNRLCR